MIVRNFDLTVCLMYSVVFIFHKRIPLQSAVLRYQPWEVLLVWQFEGRTQEIRYHKTGFVVTYIHTFVSFQVFRLFQSGLELITSLF